MLLITASSARQHPGQHGSVLIPFTDVFKYRVEDPPNIGDYSAVDYDDSSWDMGRGGFGNRDDLGVGTQVPSGVYGRAIWVRKTVSIHHVPRSVHIDVTADDGAWLWVNGVLLLDGAIGLNTLPVDAPATVYSRTTVFALKARDSVPSGSATGIFAGMTINLEY